jgi:hypothetical protein
MGNLKGDAGEGDAGAGVGLIHHNPYSACASGPRSSIRKPACASGLRSREHGENEASKQGPDPEPEQDESQAPEHAESQAPLLDEIQVLGGSHTAEGSLTEVRQERSSPPRGHARGRPSPSEMLLPNSKGSGKSNGEDTTRPGPYVTPRPRKPLPKPRGWLPPSPFATGPR